MLNDIEVRDGQTHSTYSTIGKINGSVEHIQFFSSAEHVARNNARRRGMKFWKRLASALVTISLNFCILYNFDISDWLV